MHAGMAKSNRTAFLSRFLADHGIVFALLALCIYFSFATFSEQHAEGAAGGQDLAQQIAQQTPPGARILIIVRDTREDAEFADALARGLAETGRTVVATVRGQPADARQALENLVQSRQRLDLVAANQATGEWSVLRDLGRRFPTLGDIPVAIPEAYRWPSFLKAAN